MDFSKIFKNKNKKSEVNLDSNEDIVNDILNIEDSPEEQFLENENQEQFLDSDDIVDSKIKNKFKLNMGNKKQTKFNKRLFIILGAVLALLLIVSAGIFVFMSMNKGAEELTPPKSEEQIAKEKVFASINKGVKVGQTKESIVTKFSIPKEKIGKHYAIDPTYTRIGNHDFLTTYIFSDNILVAILHERILDGTQKHKLSIEFQKFTEEIGEYYPLVEIQKEWFSPELEYDSNAWNEAISNNQLELYSNFENSENKEYVRILASGINYFNFLANDRESLSVGNLNLIYTSSDYKDKFMSFVSLATE